VSNSLQDIMEFKILFNLLPRTLEISLYITLHKLIGQNSLTHNGFFTFGINAIYVKFKLDGIIPEFKLDAIIPEFLNFHSDMDWWPQFPGYSDVPPFIPAPPDSFFFSNPCHLKWKNDLYCSRNSIFFCLF
jgi:hypothetical protein